MMTLIPLVAYLASCCYAAPFVLPRAFTSNLPQVENATANNGTALDVPVAVGPTAAQAASSFFSSLASGLPSLQRQLLPTWQGVNQFPNVAQISEAPSISMPALTSDIQNNSQSDTETQANLSNSVEFRSMPQFSLPQFNAAPMQFGLPQLMPFSPQGVPNAAYSIPDSMPNSFSYPQPYTYPYSPLFNLKPQELPRSSLSQMEVPFSPTVSTSLQFPSIKNSEQLSGVNFPSQGFPYQPFMPQNQLWPSRGQALFPSLNMNSQAGTQPIPQFANFQNSLIPQLANAQNSLIPKFANSPNSPIPQFFNPQNLQLTNLPNSPFASTLPVAFPQAVNFKPNPFQANLFPSQPVTAKPTTVQNAPSSPGFLSALFGQ